MSLEIYLDLDGVCVDFIRASIKLHGLDPDKVLQEWQQHHRGEFFPYNVLNIEMDDYWVKLHEGGEQFWIHLEPYTWFDEFYAKLGEIGDVKFCTATTRSPTCLSGKLKWLQNRFGQEFQEYILTPHKHRLAHENACLIDDSDENINRFRARGGHGILFPQIWNSNHSVDGDPVTFVLEQIDQINTGA